MKKLTFAFFPWLFVAFGYKAIAQDQVIISNDKKNKEAEEIIIRKKGSKDVNISIEIKDGKVIVNGKPMAEFKDDEITINKRKMIVRDGNRLLLGDRDGNNITGDFNFNDGDGNDVTGNFNWGDDDQGEKRAFLGVSTEKKEEGAEISEEVLPETAAGKAGLQKGDIITKLGDTKIEGPQSLYEAVSAKKPADEVKISYKRNGKQKTTKATLGERKLPLQKAIPTAGPMVLLKLLPCPHFPVCHVPRSLLQPGMVKEL